MALPRKDYIPLNNTILLARKYGQWLLGTQGDKNKDTYINELWTSFKVKGSRFDRNQPYDDNNYTAQEAMEDFVNFIGSFMSQKRLHQITGWLLEKEIQSNSSQLLRNSTLAKTFLLYEAKTHALAKDKMQRHLEKEESFGFELRKFKPDQFFDNWVIPPVLLQLYKNKLIAMICEDDQALGEHFWFNIIRPILLVELKKVSLIEEAQIQRELSALANNQNPSDAFKKFREDIAKQIKQVDEKKEFTNNENSDIKQKAHELESMLQMFQSDPKKDYVSSPRFFQDKTDDHFEKEQPVLISLNADKEDIEQDLKKDEWARKALIGLCADIISIIDKNNNALFEEELNELKKQAQDIKVAASTYQTGYNIKFKLFFENVAQMGNYIEAARKKIKGKKNMNNFNFTTNQNTYVNINQCLEGMLDKVAEVQTMLKPQSGIKNDFF